MELFLCIAWHVRMELERLFNIWICDVQNVEHITPPHQLSFSTQSTTRQPQSTRPKYRSIKPLFTHHPQYRLWLIPFHRNQVKQPPQTQYILPSTHFFTNNTTDNSSSTRIVVFIPIPPPLHENPKSPAHESVSPSRSSSVGT